MANDENLTISEETEDKNGNVKISPDVIATVASIAAGEVSGMAGMNTGVVGGIVEKFGTKKKGKGVKIEMSDEGAILDVSVVVSYGVKIPDVAWAVQENVKNSVESMTGINVLKVNVHVDGVDFTNADKVDEKEETAE